ncbi:diaminopimelate decarboxylase [Nitratidesulfovibrio sp.]|uniref:diaminopimelate decarboxylase n=1 Tax=Nitratidesulfovibrio sp. TaxID=2802297 RepID=UPI0033428724
MSFLETVGNALVGLSCRRQRRQAMPDVALWDVQVDGRGELAVDGVSCAQLAREYGTPLLVVHAGALRRRVAEVKGVMDELFGDAMVAYSYKTNCIPGILGIMHEAGVGAEAISGYEYWVAESLGVPGGLIVYNGVDKSRGSIARAIARGSLINIDSRDEVDVILAEARTQGRRARVGLRLGLNASAQFGLPPDGDEVHDIVARILADADHADLCGLHFNITSNARHSGYHVRCLTRALEFMRELVRRHGVAVRYLDIGGGYGVETSKNMSAMEYGLYRLFGVQPGRAHLEPCQGFRQYMTDIAVTLSRFCSANDLPVPTLIIEPGRLLTSKAELLLATVKAVKERPGGMPFAITDAGRLSQAFPCDFEFHETFLASDMRRPAARAYTVTGRVCTRSDWLFRARVLPELAAGDVLAVMDAGAYFSSYAMNFAFPRAAIVAVDGGRVSVLRRRESFRHLVAMDETLLLDVPEPPQ